MSSVYIAYMSEYRVLARQYRPQNFEDLVGQDVLVRTLSNAIEQDRIAHAFLLTGIRGIGKTTTARIMAKALNCLGADGNAEKPTITPCGVCANCQQIREDRHVDVLEMDAASRTGVGDIREIIDSIYYKPTSSRYKIYIIDEAHMLSNSAFNALLKTLEEPPAHVIFIFATTEIRKIPVTILSRCQRFDLRRLNTDEMAQHLKNIAVKESVQCDEEALELIAIASEGSVRDALSLLDQAIAHSDKVDNKHHITGDIVRGLLGLVDRTRLYQMMEHLFAGQCKEALDLLKAHYDDGANMATLVQDMMQCVHVVSRLLIAKDYAIDRTYSDHERQLLEKLASKLTIMATTKAWQILTKTLEDIKRAPDALAATEMLFIRFAYAANLPDPSDLIKKIQAGEGAQIGASSVSGSPAGGALLHHGTPAHAVQTAPMPQAHAQPQEQIAHLSLVANNPAQHIESFTEIVALCEREREAVLLHQLKTVAQPVSCTTGALVLSEAGQLKTDVLNRLKQLLRDKTEQDWMISYVPEAGEATIKAQKEALMQQKIAQAKEEPLVASILENFEDARIVSVETV